MSKVTQNYKLIELLKAAADPVSKQDVAKLLGVAETSVPVYIHDLKKNLKADIGTVKKGRVVTHYVLNNKNLKVNPHRKNAVGVAPKAKVKKPTEAVSVDTGEVAVLDKELDIAVVSDREMSDIRDSLGVGSGFGGGFGNHGYD